MRNLSRYCAIWLLTTCTALCAAVSTADISLGTPVSGPRVTPAMYEGRVVVIVNWDPDYYDGGEMWVKQAVDWNSRYGDKLLVIVNNFSPSDPEFSNNAWAMVPGSEIVALYRGGLLQATRDQLGGNVSGSSVSGSLGYAREGCVVFASDGTLAFFASVDKTATDLAPLVQAASGHLPAGYSAAYKSCRREAEALGALSSNLKGTLEKLRRIAGDLSDLAAQQEAQYLLDRVAAWQAQEQQEFERLMESDAGLAFAKVKWLASLLKGDELGEVWQSLQNDLSRDKTFVGRTKAEAILRSCRQEAFKMGMDARLSQAKDNKSNKQKIGKIKASLEGIVAEFPGTGLASQAQVLLQKYAL